ncbi:MAG: 3-methyl-2-oxobutanoate hydroxymethyltransferase [Candidatus Omnitrophica bacterium]|nr:3-methyl-2-oxobutanoate hydroxymethyltransferase [Candidatus Omnitrophota bacterium]
MSQRITVEEIIAKKKTGEKITVLTAYDYAFALLIDKSGIDIVLVGDSLANVGLGLDSTLDVGMTEMIHHAKAVNRGVKYALVVGDMPYEAYQIDVFKAVENAKRFVDEAGCDAIKLEWFDQCLEVAEMVIAQGIPVMGHVGLTPQTAEKLGGFKVQGKDAESAKKIIENAKALEAKGCFCVVLECVPFSLAEIITKELNIPTIGIGAGVYCDGQVLVTNDILGLYDRHSPKFVKKYVDLSEAALKAITQFRDEVKSCKFPDIEHSYSMSIEEINRVRELEK